MKTEFEFTIVLGSKASADMPELEDTLFEAGCSDALVCAYGNTVYLEFCREATSARAAINSAIKDILRAGFNILSIEEGGCASISEMSARAGLTRAALNNYLKGQRGSKDFPRPVYGLSTKSPQFKWPEVANWLYKHKKIDKNIVDVALAAQKIDVSKVSAA